MQCRIDARRNEQRLVLHLAGDLTEEYVPAFLEACASEGARLVVELDELLSADAVGVDALRRVEERGALLVALPFYLRLKLDKLEGPHRKQHAD
jgi:anti-anti-sigma regulatory factor